MQMGFYLMLGRFSHYLVLDPYQRWITYCWLDYIEMLSSNRKQSTHHVINLISIQSTVIKSEADTMQQYSTKKIPIALQTSVVLALRTPFF